GDPVVPDREGHAPVDLHRLHGADRRTVRGRADPPRVGRARGAFRLRRLPQPPAAHRARGAPPRHRVPVLLRNRAVAVRFGGVHAPGDPGAGGRDDPPPPGPELPGHERDPAREPRAGLDGPRAAQPVPRRVLVALVLPRRDPPPDRRAARHAPYHEPVRVLL